MEDAKWIKGILDRKWIRLESWEPPLQNSDANLDLDKLARQLGLGNLRGISRWSTLVHCNQEHIASKSYLHAQHLLQLGNQDEAKKGEQKFS